MIVVDFFTYERVGAVQGIATQYSTVQCSTIQSLITRFMGPTRGPPGADRTQVGPMLATSTLLSGVKNTETPCNTVQLIERRS